MDTNKDEKIQEGRLNVHSEGFKPRLKDLKKLTGSFNAGLKVLKEMTTKQSQPKANNSAK